MASVPSEKRVAKNCAVLETIASAVFRPKEGFGKNACELFATVAAYEIVRTHDALGKACGYRLRAGVSLLVAMATIVALEVVYIDHQQGQRPAIAPDTLRFTQQYLLKAAPVCHVRQAV